MKNGEGHWKWGGVVFPEKDDQSMSIRAWLEAMGLLFWANFMKVHFGKVLFVLLDTQFIVLYQYINLNGQKVVNNSAGYIFWNYNYNKKNTWSNIF